MGRISFFSSFLFVLILASCAEKPIVRYVSEFPREITITEYEELPFDLLAPEQIFVSSKFIVVLQRHEERMIRVYDKLNGDYISSFLSNGRGPNEVVMMNRIGQTDLSEGDFKIKIQSYPSFFAWLDIDSSVREGHAILTDKVEFSGASNSSNYLAIANSVYYLEGKDQYLMFIDPERSNNRPISSSPFSVIYESQSRKLSDTLYWYHRPNQDAPTILFAHSSSISYNKKYLGRANRYINSVIILDVEANRTQTICFDEKAMDLNKAEEEKIVYFSESAADDNSFFAVKNYDSSSTFSEIYVIDWQGTPIVKMITPFKIRSLFVAESNQFYAITEDDRIVQFECDL